MADNFNEVNQNAGSQKEGSSIAVGEKDIVHPTDMKWEYNGTMESPFGWRPTPEQEKDVPKPF